MIFHHQNLLGVEGQLVPIRNGLRNWINIWERYFESWLPTTPGGMPDNGNSLETMWKRVGFIRHSAEYWLLGSLLTDRISATHASQGQSADRSLLGDVTESRGIQTQRSTIDPILDKYDQTSMRQVNDLITDFQKFHVDQE